MRIYASTSFLDHTLNLLAYMPFTGTGAILGSALVFEKRAGGILGNEKEAAQLEPQEKEYVLLKYGDANCKAGVHAVLTLIALVAANALGLLPITAASVAVGTLYLLMTAVSIIQKRRVDEYLQKMDQAVPI